MNDDRLGPYRLLRRLGEGGMGVVHLAVDSQGREVAVKVLRSEVTGDDVARRRLAREVETMRRVRSPHIAEVLDADVTGHRPYIVTRYVPGQPLDDIVKQDGPLDLPAVLKVARGVAAALAAVHAVGVIHRDLKPGNVLIMSGDPVLIDFGIAQAVDATRLTQTGMFIGTPGYLAPEIIEGQVAGPEVDVHAWAGTMLYACTGEPPFGKGTLEMVFYNITAGKANVDAAPSVLRPLLRAAFQRDPAKRPTAAELADGVARLMPASDRQRVPDEITTVPEVAENGKDIETPTPAVGPPRARVLAPPPAVPGPPSRQEYVSLLGDQSGAVPPSSAASPAASPAVSPPVSPEPPTIPAVPEEGDPWPTRRVTPEELRKARSGTSDLPPGQGGSAPAARSSSWDVPTQADPAAVPSQAHPSSRSWDVPTRADPGAVPTPYAGKDASSRSWDVPTRADPGAVPTPYPGQEAAPTNPVNPGVAEAMRNPAGSPTGSTQPPTPTGSAQSLLGRPSSPGDDPGEGDVPTRRVRPGELPDYLRGPGRPAQSAQQAPVSGPQSPPTPYPQDTPHLPPPYPGQQSAPEGHRRGHSGPPPQAYPYQQPAQPGEPYHGYQQPAPPSGAHAVPTLKRSKAYGVSAGLLLVVMTAAAVLAPVLVALVAIPLAVLLRAADLAQRELNARRAPAAAALDVIRVVGQPGALVKSVLITIALVPYALILGLPVTLLLTVLLRDIPPQTALSWGLAVAVWTVCAGPGVEGPGRQMRRTLSSLLPTPGVAVGVTCALAVAAVVAALAAAATLGTRVMPVIWSPVDIQPVVEQLSELRSRAAR